MSTPRPNVTSAGELKRLLAHYNVQPAKKLGQNFLIDGNIVKRILAAADIGPDDNVFEVGPGAGALTLALADAAGRVVALELDRRMVEMLRSLLADAPNVTIAPGDILKSDLRGLLGDGQWKLLSNLPYAIVGQAVARMIEHIDLFPLMLLMMQREVADRLAAPPRGADYGVLSVVVQAQAKVEIVWQVSHTCFFPQPTVDSSLVRLTRLPVPVVPVDLTRTFVAVVRAVFRQRRKMLFNGLAAVELNLTREQAQQALEAAGIERTLRPQSLSAEGYARLAREVQALRAEAGE